MAHFYSTIQGSRGSASRCGTKNSGLTATANGWDIGSEAWLHHNHTLDRDEVTLYVTTGSNGNKRKRLPTIYLDLQGNWRSDNELMQRLLDE